MRSAEHHLFFASSIGGDVLRLDADETRHLTSVLRLKPGGKFQATDGKGAVHACTLTDVGKEFSLAHVDRTTTTSRPHPCVHLYAGIPDRAAFDEMAESAAALGVSRLVPLECAYCQDKWWDKRWSASADRFERKMVAGAKQALNPWLTELASPTSLEYALRVEKFPALVGDDEGLAPSLVLPRVRTADGVAVFVGPPGGFSPEEHQRLEAIQPLKLRLSGSRLRTEMAASLICGILMAG